MADQESQTKSHPVRNFFLGMIACIVGLMIIGAILGESGNQTTPGVAAGAPADEKESQAEIHARFVAAMPQVQKDFLMAIQRYTTEYSEQPNELKKSAVKTRRGAELLKIMGGTTNLDGWAGVIEEMGTNGDGDAYLTLIIGTDTRVKTWNNAFSDIEDRTLIKQSNPMFATLAELRERVAVRFSARVIKEGSVTEEGGMLEPEFIARFSSIEPLFREGGEPDR